MDVIVNVGTYNLAIFTITYYLRMQMYAKLFRINNNFFPCKYNTWVPIEINTIGNNIKLST